MDDLISRQAAIEAVEFGITYAKAFNKESGEVRELFREGNNELRKAVKRIKKLPSAQPEQKVGKRMLAEDGWYCSACELYPPFDCDPEEKGIPYCPHCGAKMEVNG